MQKGVALFCAFNFTPQKYEKFLKLPNMLTFLTFVLKCVNILHNSNIILNIAGLNF